MEPLGEIATVTLEKLKAAARLDLGAATVESLRLQFFQDDITNRLLAGLTAHVLAQKLGDHTERVTRDVEFHEPSSPWQHVKRDAWLFRTRPGRWFVNRYPVRTKTVIKRVTLVAHWKQYATFPRASIITDARLGAPVLLLQKQAPTWTEY